MLFFIKEGCLLMSQIEFKDVSKVYPNGHVGLKDINLNIEKVFVIVGLSGAGKSTLLRSVNRLHDISKGDITIEGQSITKARAGGIGLFYDQTLDCFNIKTTMIILFTLIIVVIIDYVSSKVREKLA